MHQFRHASELRKEHKGGYLDENIKFDFSDDYTIRSIKLILVITISTLVVAYLESIRVLELDLLNCKTIGSN